MSDVLTNVSLIAVFILIGGTFAAAEMALVSLRDSQVKAMSSRGKRGQAIERLISNPNTFLGAVQIGVTLSGFLSAAFGGATLSRHLSPILQRWGLGEGVADTASLVLITVVISYFSIVLGELTSKRLAMQRAEGFSMALAPMVDAIARAARPILWFLGKSTDVAVRLLGGDPDASREEVTDEELRAMVSGSQTLGAEERQILDEVFDAGERSLREVMVPRTEVDFLPGDMPAYKVIRAVQGAPHSRYPVTDGSSDHVLGFLHVRDLMDLDHATRAVPIRQLVRPVLSLPETVRVLRALSDMRRESSHLAIVRDEYGGTSGIVTLEDLVEELVGEISDEYDEPETDNGHDSFSDVDGLMTLEEFAEKYGYLLSEGPYDTVAGYFMARQGRLPSVGDSVVVELSREMAEETIDKPDTAHLRLEVTEMEGRRAAWLTGRWVEGAEPLPLQEPAVDVDSASDPEPSDDARDPQRSPAAGNE